MEGVFPFKKYIMFMVEDRPVPSLDCGDENRPIVYTINYRGINEEGEVGSYRLSVSQYEALGKPKLIELDTSEVDPHTGDFVVRKLE